MLGRKQAWTQPGFPISSSQQPTEIDSVNERQHIGEYSSHYHVKKGIIPFENLADAEHQLTS